MKELLEKISSHAAEFDKDKNPAEYNEVLKLIRMGYVKKIGAFEESDAIVVRITKEGRDTLLKL